MSEQQKLRDSAEHKAARELFVKEARAAAKKFYESTQREPEDHMAQFESVAFVASSILVTATAIELTEISKQEETAKALHTLEGTVLALYGKTGGGFILEQAIKTVDSWAKESNAKQPEATTSEGGAGSELQ